MSYSAVRILVIDDMSTMRKIICKTVKEMGVGSISDAPDGEEAWKIIQASENGFDLILSDWNMPNCTGIELLKRVRGQERTKATPFVLLTAESESHQVKEAVTLGVTGYIVKPFTPDILKQKLAGILDKAKAA